MKRYLLFLLGFLASLDAFATHYRAGELTYRVLSYLSFEVTVTTYTTDINVPPDSDTVQISWGDGTTSSAFRIAQQPLGNNIKKNVYRDTHTYPGPRPFYVISVTDPNRIGGITNINNGIATENIPFYIEDTLRVFDPAFTGFNNSPILLNAPIDFANVGDLFYHNPAAYDPDGDSLVFELIPSKQGMGSNVPVYLYPDEVQPIANNNFTINSQTGEIIWDVPQRTGIFNIAILVREYRDGNLMGTVLRDMQIIVKQEFNNPPVIADIRDTCIVAGTLLTINVTATDPDPGQTVILTAAGGPLDADTINPADFASTSNVGFANGIFDWQTECGHIREQSYQVVFKAQDDYTSGFNQLPLTDLETWIIKIVGPSPENLQATAVGDNIDLTWQSPYICDGSETNKFQGFSVWRREGSNPFVIDTCTPGLDGRGYTKIADLVTAYTYTDTAVARGKQYCYRILAEFAEKTQFGLLYNKVSSLASNEACAQLKRDLPIITNVTVDITDVANGQITVKWVKPLVPDLDTIQNPGPYTFNVFRAEGFTGGAGRVQVATTNSPFLGTLNDTVFTDNGLNTQDLPYHYEIEFVSNGNSLGFTEQASSVYLTVRPNDRQLDLSWEASVPWLNELYEIYRLNPVTAIFELIDTTDTTRYSDVGLINDSLYCYKVQTIGRYTITGLPEPLLNFSQEACQRPRDTIPPCPPTLMVANPCNGINDGDVCTLTGDDLKNLLSWTNPNNSCANDTKGYYIYYSPPGDSAFLKVDSILIDTDTSYRHSYNNSLAGCYYVTAIDTNANESDSSNNVCVDNCPCYRLPNVFTPNADGDNDFYKPLEPYRFISRVEMKIYNRWGALVFETENPAILWNGNTTKGNKPLPEDTYYYVCKVFEIRVDGERESDSVLSGFIHLIRGNGGSNP
ncbi:MAG: gliding motility-associated C-terminal domain-containing protein [Chitinophagales bacterium]|nr:gliding motility-associated C-terminal domain-containing protein [Chitinophagales bacterium]